MDGVDSKSIIGGSGSATKQPEKIKKAAVPEKSKKIKKKIKKKNKKIKKNKNTKTSTKTKKKFSKKQGKI